MLILISVSYTHLAGLSGGGYESSHHEYDAICPCDRGTAAAGRGDLHGSWGDPLMAVSVSVSYTYLKAMFIVDPHKERIAVAEARKLNIPRVAIVDTNCNPDEIDYAVSYTHLDVYKRQQVLNGEGLICNEAPDDDVQAACRKLGADLAAW